MTEIELSKMKESGGENGPSEPMSPTAKLTYPKAVFFVIATELSERFSYYGMRAVLTLYLTNMLGYSDNLATTLYHSFLLICYGSPVIWGIVADSFLGKFRTIWMLSICFALGNIILTLSSIPPLHFPPRTLAMIGLFCMALGTGGMKPTVAPFGGEQFTLPQQEKSLQKFFSVFFFAVTIGNMISTVITPIFREDVHCFDMESCYPLAFGVPACIMILAIVIFTSGKSLYKMNKPAGNILVDVVGCITYALSKKKSDDENEKSHWLDRASDKYEAKLIRDVKGLLRVLLYYLPVPMFFALYEQLGSRWTLQATRMTGKLGSFRIKPDQMQVCNALMMFIFIPIFQYGIYPLFGKCNLLKRPLQKMCIGGFLAAASFLVAGIVEKQIEHYVAPKGLETHVNFINTFPCPIEFESEIMDKTVMEGESSIIKFITTSDPLNLTLGLSDTCNFKVQSRKWQGVVKLIPGELQTVVIHLNGDSIIASGFLKGEDVDKSKEGKAKIRTAYTDSTDNSLYPHDVSLELTAGSNDVFRFKPTAMNAISPWAEEVQPNKYSASSHFLMGTQTGLNEVELGEIDLLTGGSYLILIYPNYEKFNSLKRQLIELSPPNEIHMLWLIPQYILMAWGEILFVVSGMEFSFTEAPVSMKSVLQSCWHLMNAFGNIIVILSAQGKSSHQATEFFAFSGAMFVDAIILCVLANRYKYVSTVTEEDANANHPKPSLTPSFKIDQHI